MHPEAAYWALLSGQPPEDEAAIAACLGAWHAKGKRSVNELFDRDPDQLADALGISRESLAPLIALRPGLPHAHRLVDRLARDGVELVTVWEHRYPRELRSLLGDAAPIALWHVGALRLLDDLPIALLGSRAAPPESLEFARQVGAGLARAGRPVLTGISRAVERAALDAALRMNGGTAVVILGQGIERVLPELRRRQQAIRENRLLVASVQHPEAAWAPWLEALRGLISIGLADKVVVAHACAGEDVWDTTFEAMQFGQDVFIRAGVDDELERLGAVALPVADKAAGTILGVQPLLEVLDGDETEASAEAASLPLTPLRSDHALDAHGAPIPSREQASPATLFPLAAPAAAASGSSGRPRPRKAGKHASIGAAAREGMPMDGQTDSTLIWLLERNRGKPVAKGALLAALNVDEAALDAVLAELIGERIIEQRQTRGRIAYALAAPGRSASGGTFQPSLFGPDT